MARCSGRLRGHSSTLGRLPLPLAPISLAMADSLATDRQAIPQPVLTGLVGGFIAWVAGACKR